MSTAQNTSIDKKDFFISYTSANKEIAEWIAWILEGANYSTIIQAWDFHAGAQFPIEMQEASMKAERVITCLSREYFNSSFTQPEWAAYFVKDPKGKDGKIIPVRIEDFTPPGMFSSMLYIDLVGLAEDEAKRKLLDEISARVQDLRRKPKEKPAFIPVNKALDQWMPAFSMIPARDELNISSIPGKNVTINFNQKEPVNEQKKKWWEKWNTWVGVMVVTIGLITALIELPGKIIKNLGLKETSSIVADSIKFDGIVLDTAGTPISGALLIIDLLPGKTIATTSDGGYLFSKVPGKPGDAVRVKVSAAGYKQRDNYFTLPGPARIVLEKQ